MYLIYIFTFMTDSFFIVQRNFAIRHSIYLLDFLKLWSEASLWTSSTTEEVGPIRDNNAGSRNNPWNNPITTRQANILKNIFMLIKTHLLLITLPWKMSRRRMNHWMLPAEMPARLRILHWRPQCPWCWSCPRFSCFYPQLWSPHTWLQYALSNPEPDQL